MLVTATNVGGNNFKNDAVLAFAVAELELGEIDALNFDDSRTHVSHSAVTCHVLTPP
jgi:hypothetical protein